MRLRILHPCPKSFEELRGEGAARFCDTCHRAVFDLSQRTQEEARAFLREREGQRTCVRLARSAAGALVFAAATASCSAALPSTPPEAPVVHELGDIVPDEIDRCPDQPEPNEQGCPTRDAGPAHH